MRIIAANAPFRTRSHGTFRIHVTQPTDDEPEHIVLTRGDLSGVTDVPCRVASQCVTSTAFDADDCDCAGQLTAALAHMNQHNRGILMYLNQEGRGHGLATKVTAMNGKARGLDTFEAVEELGLAADIRSYAIVKSILDHFEITSVALITNNPFKALGIAELGVKVTRTVPCIADDPPLGAERHLAAKRLRGHTL